MREFRFSATRKVGRSQLLFATILVLLIVLADLLSGGMVRGAMRSLTARVWAVSAYMRGAILESGYFASRAALSSENAGLREDLAQYREDAAAYQVLKQENESLRAMLRLAQSQPGITAPIVSSVISSPYGTFLVGAGTADAIEKGNLVVTEGGFVVGTISEVSTHTSLVNELFAGGSSVAVLVGGTSIEAEGRGGGNARIIVPRGISIAPGDPVTSPSLGGRAVGIVGKVESDPASAVQTVYVVLPVNLGALRYIYVVPHQ